ncbi:hypothetical protein [Mangrovihabitans endophyticus]|uniref:Uncharacterized protein n=1 Tax=Mangrovihabitans endophyticus TaxID=1751298 RepID=A0A8J3FN00_9ACTN|nr:hypothetical protein [Mangrovihabitans endophyticus]GGK88416.1 hypothetical protein GCM10012284_23060 [Mangrovihabitans endophyticus]
MIELGRVLDDVFDGEPGADGAVDAVYRRADEMRRRKIRAVISAGLASAAVVVAVGYGVATLVIPRSAAGTPGADPAASGSAEPPDQVLAALRPVVGDDLMVLPRHPSRGAGWRQYLTVGTDGRSRGLIEVSVYDAPDDLCFPVLADAGACARPEHRDGVDFVRYAFDSDVDWQVNEVIARRRADGRTIVVLATGERGTGSAAAGRPPLTGAQATEVATAGTVAAAFDGGEQCNGPDPVCPVLRVRVPVPAPVDD